jgi:hypothetical protein
MPKGPRGEKRPADVVSAAVMVGRIATGEVEDTLSSPKSGAQREGGLKGGKARAESLSSDRRAEIAKQAAKARWSKGNDK